MARAVTNPENPAQDQGTADAFADSWNHLPPGSIYTGEQVSDWFAPIMAADVVGKRVLEMGCGNGSLLAHVLGWSPGFLHAIDLGGSVKSAEANLKATGHRNWLVQQADLVTFNSEGFDIVYSIGVLHHLRNPQKGFEAVLRNTKPGGRFHCWVYAREGNGIVIALVDPIRKITSRLPWWVTKYLIATALVVPFCAYAKLLSALPRWPLLRRLPLYDYSLWIARREFAFFRHVAFDQLVTPQTTYIDRATIEHWLQDSRIDPDTVYILMRNGNSWKFGGRVR